MQRTNWIYGDGPGLGKTTFACELAARGSGGELVGAAADVIFATTEDSLAHTLVPRFTAADADLDRVHFMQILEAGFEVGLTLPDHLPRLQDLVEKTGANLIVLDPVVGHLSGNIDSYKDHSVRRALAPLATLAEKTGAAILGVMHLNKSSSTDVLTRVSGSVAFGAAARSVLLLGEDPNAVEGGPERLLIHGKSNLGPPAVAMRLRVEGRRITTEGGEIETSGIAVLGDDATATAARVLAGRQEPSAVDKATEFLRENLADGAMLYSKIKELAAEEGITLATLKRASTRLGIVSKKKFGGGSSWSLPLQWAHSETHSLNDEPIGEPTSRKPLQDKGSTNEPIASGDSSDAPNELIGLESVLEAFPDAEVVQVPDAVSHVLTAPSESLCWSSTHPRQRPMAQIPGSVARSCTARSLPESTV